MRTLIVLLATMALIGFLPTVVADDLPYAYLSGECYNSNATEGGHDAAGVNEGGEVMILNPGSGGAVDALVLFGTQSALAGGQTGTACAHNGYGTPHDTDHLQVRAGAGDILVVVCYDGQVNFEPSRCPAQGGK